MDRPDEFRELLVADLALVLGYASARDVALALQRYWDQREEGGIRFASELARIANLGEGSAARLEEEVDGFLTEFGGDARRAIRKRGGIDRTIHEALPGEAQRTSLALAQVGAGPRVELRSLPLGRYQDFSRLAEGGMGIVFLALDTELNRRVAFKIVRPDAGDKTAEIDASTPLSAAPPEEGTPGSSHFAELTSRFLQEAWVTGGLEHPGIVPVYELGLTPEGVPYYTMRFVRGARTLEDVISAATCIGDRLGLLELFLKVCDAINYAHAKGVIHRDLKPRNIVVGEFGEVVVLDWGLAKTTEHPDLMLSTWQKRVAEYREATDLETVASILGTPGYMAPEAALDEADPIDERADVYSLGSLLHMILTGRLPFLFETVEEWLWKLSEDTPRRACEVDPAVPQPLSRICEKALSRRKEDRHAEAGELAAVVRTWQGEHAVESEVAGLTRDAETAYAATEGLTGEDLLRQLDRVTAVTSRILEVRPDSPIALDLVMRGEAAREHAIRERERAARVRMLRPLATAVLTVGIVAAVVVLFLVDAKRREAERERGEKVKALALSERERERANAERDRAGAERDAKTEALDRVFRLADSKKVRDLIEEAEDLWPLHPDLAPRMEAWIARVRKVLRNREAHEQVLAALERRALPYTESDRKRDHADAIASLETARETRRAIRAELKRLGFVRAVFLDRGQHKQRALQVDDTIKKLEKQIVSRGSWAFPDATDAWRHQVLSDLVSGLAVLVDGKDSLIADVGRRLAFSTSLAGSLQTEHRAAWDATIDAITDVEANPRYRGLRFEPVVGLVPLGKDPVSGLYEFAHLGSGSLPTRDASTGKLVLRTDAAIVLVLVPAGTFTMGAQSQDAAQPNFDPQAGADESPVHEVSLSAYFIAKHECTQAQWEKMTGGGRPSRYGPGGIFGFRIVSERNPVEQVNWEEAMTCLARHRLTLPSEAQWERACRAGTETPWSTGRIVADLGKAGNIGDAYCKIHSGVHGWELTEEVNDGHLMHAQVGSLAPNAFGLHDMIGNVREWCLDIKHRYAAVRQLDPVTSVGLSVNRIHRGGGWISMPRYSRSASRLSDSPLKRNVDMGLRPASGLLK